ncbi:MAG: IPT/TIG domain-containing protein, partial [Bacteroidales bacterium]|nr:IPT/TIG domain-containing protein [Bacteroidales bacterium]
GVPSESTFIGSLTGDLNETTGFFRAEVGTGITQGEEYHFTAFAVAGSIITLGNELSYESKGSQAARIADFYPDKGVTNDTVFIKLSENIGGISNYVVKFNQHTANIIDFFDDELRVVVPVGLDIENTISIQTGTVVDNATKKFMLNEKLILDFQPKTGKTLDTITIQIGEPFKKGGSYVVRFNDHLATITYTQDNILKAVVPSALSVKESTISLKSGDYTSYSAQTFQLTPCTISSFSPTEVSPSQTVTIYGDNFHRLTEKNIVWFDNVPLIPFTSSSTELKVNIPAVLAGKECHISVTIDNQTTVSADKIKIIGVPVIWERVSDYPGGSTHKLGAFAMGNYGYAGLGVKIGNQFSNKFWRYDPALNDWIEIASFPGQTRIEPHGFSINGIGYMGGGHNVDSPSRVALRDYYKYDPELNQWAVITSYPGSILNLYKGAFGATAEKGFISFTYDDFYSLEPGTNVWTKLANPPNGMVHDGSVFTIENTVYFVGGIDRNGVLTNEVWAYNTLTDTWTRKNDFPGLARRGCTGFSSGDLGFFGLGANLGFTILYKDIWKYYPLTDSWVRIEDFPGSARTGPFVFVLDDIAYIGGGYISSGVLTDEVYRLVISNVR